MGLLSGTKLGPYEVLSPLGAGGMGEVYRARDTRLNRTVAIKILLCTSLKALKPGSVSTGKRAPSPRSTIPTSSWSSTWVPEPDAGRGAQYIVCELIDGDSLRTIISGKPLSLRRLLDIAVQTADGLAAAHAANIVHRDLKPENILLTKEGRVKILDFGLASQSRVASELKASDVTVSTRHCQDLTNTGTIAGTASYMSPEQALGKQIDYRSDQFSFGFLLHDGLGKNFAATTMLKSWPRSSAMNPLPLDKNSRRRSSGSSTGALSKEREQRYESTRDLYKELRNLREHFADFDFSSGVAVPMHEKSGFQRWKIPAGFTVCIVGAALFGYLLKPLGEDIGNYRYTPFAPDATNPIWSPDGKAVAYSAGINGTYQVFLRYLTSSVPVQLTHEKEDLLPLGWSSDKSHLILLQSTDSKESPLYKLYSVPLVGGELDFVMNSACDACDLSRDGNMFATLAKGKGRLLHSLDL